MLSSNQKRLIPRIIHQCVADKNNVRHEYHDNIRNMLIRNPLYEHVLYENNDFEDFLYAEYGQRVLDKYLRITPAYGASKADFFRYALLYKRGGIYLDIKSTCDLPFDDVLNADDRYILSHWRNTDRSHPHYKWGVFDDIAHMPHGEYQQWHIIAEPGHAYLEAVLALMLERIDRYKPWTTGFGHMGVMRTTGPIMYSQAIDPIREHHPHRVIANETVIGLRYSIFEGQHDHRRDAKHYGDSFDPVFRMDGSLRLASAAYLGMVKTGDRYVRQPMRRLAHTLRGR
jgi:mannosyltransferase OCH1-like enzyme